MIEISSNQVTPQLKALFDPDMPTGIRCFAVLGGGNAGRIFTDHPAHPQSGYVWERDDGTLYRGGAWDRQGLQQMVEFLRKDEIVALGFRDEPNMDDFPPDPQAGAECIELERATLGSDLSPYLGLPAGYEAHRMNRQMLEKSPRLEDILHRYGDLEKYLALGMNVSILHGDELVAEAGADMAIDGRREAGIFTEPAYRGKGYGTVAVAHLLKWCDEEGCATYWDVVKLNCRSLKIARKLGFSNERSYKLLAWFPPSREAGIR